MIIDNFMKWPVLLIGACLVAALAGCSLVPGQYLGVTASVNESDKPYVYDLNDAQSIAERADIFSITPASVAAQIEKRQKLEKLTKTRAQVSTSSKQDDYVYRVALQDVLRVTVWNHPELNNPAGTLSESQGRVVNNDGYFFYPYAGMIKAAGRTVQEIRDELENKLSKVLVQPQVDVSIMNYRGKRAYVLGLVEKPGVVPITDVPLTVTDLIAQAGGLKAEADLQSASLRRGSQSIPINLYALYYEGDFSQNMQVAEGDVLTIPENRYNKVFVLGEVTKPQSIVMPRGRLSLAEAVSDSGGFNPLTANAGQVYVIRDGGSGRPQIWHLNAASPDALVLADQFDLLPRDIVYVDPAGVARFGRVVSNILPTVTVLRATLQN